MEEIYPPEGYGASDHFPLEEYFKNFASVLPLQENSHKNLKEMSKTQYLLATKELMDTEMSYNDLNNLSKACSIDYLTCPGEDTKKYPIKVPDNITSRLNLPSPFITTQENHLSVTKRLKELEKQQNATFLSKNRSYHQKLEFPVLSTPPDLIPHSEFVVSVFVHRPLAFNFFNAKNASEKLRFSHEILVLGRNTLGELRDSIVCSSDFGVCKEVENTGSDLVALADSASIYPSGFIFIDDTFYNDFRHPDAIDYSLPIMKWAKEKNLKNLQSKSIENVTINSLSPRLGYPYLYMHQGDCEHLLVFADAKLLYSSDCLHSNCYPHIKKLNRSFNRMCVMCSVTFAKWICIGSDRLPQHKVFLCTECCNSYNYLNGEKLGQFKLYPYYEKHVL